MRTAVRCLLSLIVVMAGQTSFVHGADPSAAPPPLTSRPTDADMLGAWTGTITLDGASEPMDGGLITISRTEADRLTVTVGPGPRVRYSCVRLTRTEQGLRFEVSLPGEDTRLLVYDVAIERGTMTGTVTFVRHGLTRPGRLAFVRE